MTVEVEELSKSFGTVPVLRSITETFAEAQISVLLGASGCGKTTTLRCVAGLERPDRGRIAIGGRTVYQATPALSVPVERRKVSMVFQSYAIWPHMTVFQNVSLPLRAARMDRPAVLTRVTEVLKLVGLDGLADRSATALSGGQQQRVALARCIVSDAPVILMDEPLSNLDAKLRIAMRGEIADLQRRLNRTILFVTHDQEEAMSIADTIYLFNEGQVLQKGTPRELYENPKTRYAAEFLGRANIIPIRELATDTAGRPSVRLGDLAISLPSGTAASASLCVRPEKWSVQPADAEAALRGSIIATQYVGDRTELRVDTVVGTMAVIELSAADRRVGDRVGLRVDGRDVRVLP
ncbi:MAG TPA: ABC transporter ATP-binding protein [Xanthobacteraceae bacterium]|nr:ABC transporter ATP-binding protein [Xanthobacteraceae bacterium]